MGTGRLPNTTAADTAFRRTPIASEMLEAEDYHWLGKLLGKLGVLVFSLLESGYSDALPELIFAYLKGLAGR